MFIDWYDKSTIYMITDDETESLKVVVPMILASDEVKSVCNDINSDMDLEEYAENHVGSQSIMTQNLMRRMRHYSSITIENAFGKKLFRLDDKDTYETVESFDLVTLVIHINDNIGEKLPEFLYHISMYMTTYYYECMKFIKESKVQSHEEEGEIFKHFFEFVNKITEEYSIDSLQCFTINDIIEGFSDNAELSADLDAIETAYNNSEARFRDYDFEDSILVNFARKNKIVRVEDARKVKGLKEKPKKSTHVKHSNSTAVNLMNQIIFDSENTY